MLKMKVVRATHVKNEGCMSHMHLAIDMRKNEDK
jgi:hypothetical protein